MHIISVQGSVQSLVDEIKSREQNLLRTVKVKEINQLKQLDVAQGTVDHAHSSSLLVEAEVRRLKLSSNPLDMISEYHGPESAIHQHQKMMKDAEEKTVGVVGEMQKMTNVEVLERGQVEELVSSMKEMAQNMGSMVSDCGLL